MSRTSSIIGKAIFLALIFMSFSSLKAQTKGTFVDPRNGVTYETVTYKIPETSEPISDHDEYASYLSGNWTKYEVSLSELPTTITWMTQNLNFEMEDSKCKSESDEGCKEYGRLYKWEAATQACPAGWHLPSDDEWYILASLYGGVVEAGMHLKSKNLNGTNKSEFNVKKPAIFWSSNELDEASALDWKVNYRWVKLQRWKGGKELLNAVRCVQDY